VWSSPGRVNLIGDHTDYNDGFALPAAIDRFAVMAVGLRDDDLVRCTSLQIPGEVTVRLGSVEPGPESAWASHVVGTLWAMRDSGVSLPGLALVIDSAIPIGGGLASSAALAVTTALAAGELTGRQMSLDDIARCCQAGEHSVAGAPTGLMDQLAVLAGRSGNALFLDCRTLARELVPLRPGDLEASLLVIDTTVAHANSAGAYGERREESRRAAAELGVRSLRDATLEMVEARLRGTLLRRARHVVTENARVLRSVELLRAGELPAIGELLDQSHSSLRDDYEVSCPELDLAVETARGAGALGARMTGAGFGGCAFALVRSGECDAVAETVRGAFTRAGYRPARVFAVATADGAHRCV
jgi:galactokinase